MVMDLDALKKEIRQYLNSQGIPDSLAVNILSAAVVSEGEPVADYKKLFDIPAVDPNVPELAELKIAGLKASSEYKDRDFAKYALDGNPDTHFAAKGKGQFLILNLGGKQEVSEIDIKWYEGHLRRMEYEIYKKIEHTDPNLQWVRLGSALSSGTANNEYENHVFDHPFVTDQIKIVGLGNSLNSFMSIVDLKVKGKQLVEPEEPQPDNGGGGSGGNGGTEQPEGTELYNSDSDFAANVGKTLPKEKQLAPEKVFNPSHASGDEMGPDNHKVMEVDYGNSIGKQIVKVLEGNQVRDYDDIYMIDATCENLELEDQVCLYENTDDWSIKFGNHSLADYMLGGIGISVHPDNGKKDANTIQSKNEYNHGPKGSNDGEEEKVKMPKPLPLKQVFGCKVRMQTVQGQQKKVLNVFIRYPNETEYTHIMKNRFWDNKKWLDGLKAGTAMEELEADNNEYKKKTGKDYKDYAAIKAGVYMGPYMRVWKRINGVTKKGRGEYFQERVRKIGPATA